MSELPFRFAWLIAVSFFTLTACNSMPVTETAKASDIRITSLPPTAKGAISALLSSAEVPLSVDSSCHQAGTSPDDKTLGEYLSGFLAELNDPDGRNYIEVEITPAAEPAQRDGWLVRVMAGQSLGEIEWLWGIEFFIHPNGTVDPASYRCVGAG